jgi:hypothetical protein
MRRADCPSLGRGKVMLAFEPQSRKTTLRRCVADVLVVLGNQHIGADC